jgi:hypothetical protein
VSAQARLFLIAVVVLAWAATVATLAVAHVRF